MRLPQETEAILAAAAHYFTSTRNYSSAIAVLECCQALTGHPECGDKTERQLEAVNALAVRLFTGWPKAFSPEQAELASLRRSVRKLRRLLIGKVGRGKSIKTIYDVLRFIERRPGFYLRQPTLEHVSYFMSYSLSPFHYKFVDGDPSFGSFPAWVDRRYRKFQGGGHSWDQVLLRAADGDEQKAFKLFFKELRAFRRSEKGA